VSHQSRQKGQAGAVQSAITDEILAKSENVAHPLERNRQILSDLGVINPVSVRALLHLLRPISQKLFACPDCSTHRRHWQHPKTCF